MPETKDTVYTYSWLSLLCIMYVSEGGTRIPATGTEPACDNTRIMANQFQTPGSMYSTT